MTTKEERLRAAAQAKRARREKKAARTQTRAAKGKRNRQNMPAGLTRSSRVRMFIESSIFDYILVLALSTALAFTVSYGFESAADYRGNPFLIASIQVPVLIALFAGSWSKRAVPFAAVATVVLVGGITAAGAALTPADVAVMVSFDEGVINDTADCYVLFALVCAVVPVVTYLLSRRTWGLVLLFATTIVACGLIQFLYRDWAVEGAGVSAALVALFCVIMLFVYQTYKQSVYSAKRAKRTAFPAAFTLAAAISLVCMVIGVGVFYGVVNGMGIQTPEIKPFTHLYARPELQSTQSYQKIDIHDDETTNNENDQTDDSERNAEGGQEQNEGQENQSSGQSLLETLTNAFDASDWNQEYNQINYQIIRLTVYIVAALILLLIVGSILFQRYRRTLRLKRLQGKPRAYAVWYLYEFLLGRFRRLKMAKPEQLTPMEYAVGFQQQMMPFAQNTGGVDFVDVTDLYQRACLGALPVSDEDYERLVGYYRAFFKNARKYVRFPKWLFKFWRM